MTRLWTGDCETGDLSQFGGWEYGGTFDNTPPLAQRVQVVQSIGALDPAQGNYFMRVQVWPGDQYGGSSGWRTMGRQDDPIPLRSAGYDSTLVWAQEMPSGYPSDANVFVATREWHHTGGAVAPSHLIAYSPANGIRIDVCGGLESNKTVYVDQQVLVGYTSGDWYVFCERYRHNLAPNGHYELWAGRLGVDASMTQLIYKPNIGTMYQGFDNYLLLGAYRAQTGSGQLIIDMDAWAEFSALSEGLAYANGILGSTTPDPDPPSFPPPTSTLPVNTRDRRVGVTAIGSQRFGITPNYMLASKIKTNLVGGEEGDAYDFHFALQGGDNIDESEALTAKLFADTDGDGDPDTLIGTCSSTDSVYGDSDAAWRNMTGTAIRFTGENVWLSLQTITYENVVLLDAPKAFYQLQDAAGNPVDSSGNGLNITTVSGTPIYHQPGPVAANFSIQLDSTERLSLSGPISTVTNNFTMEMWIYPITVGSNDRILIFNGNGSANGWGIDIDTNFKFQYLAGNVAFGALSAAALPANTWSLIHVQRVAGTWKYYINGVLDTANAGTTNPNTPSGGQFQIGSTDTNWSARYAYVAVYESVLSAQTILDHYNAMSISPGVTNRVLVATDPASNGMAYATPIANPFNIDGFEDVVISACFDYDVVAGTPTPPSDAVAPALATAAVVSNAISLDYDEPLNSDVVPDAADIEVKVNGIPRGISLFGDAVIGSRLSISLDNDPVVDTDVVTVSYTPATNKLQDLAGNFAAALVDEPVTNNTPDLSEPAVTELPSSVLPTSVQLNGIVNPGGVNSVAYFEYGITLNLELGATTPQAVGAGVLPVPVEADVTGLNPGVQYFFRIVRDDV